MKKMFIIIAALICISMLIMLTACGNDTDQNSSYEESSTSALDPIPLTQNSSYAGGVTTSNLKTEEGVEIQCSDNYMMGHEAGGQFWFALSDEERETGEYLTESYDWKMEFTSSNAEFVKVEYYYEGTLIGSEECENNTAIVDQEYNEQYCDTCVLYLMYTDTLYTAEFIRTGE